MAEIQKSKVVPNLKKNRLTITIASIASKREAERIYTDLRFCVPDLKPGFDVIADFSHCTVAHLNAIPTMRMIMDYLVVNRPDNIIRIVGEKSLIFRQLFRLTQLFQSYMPIYASSFDEAERLLENGSRRRGLRFNKHRQQVEFKIDQEKGKARLVDISTSGCKIQGLTIPLVAEQQLSLRIPFHQDHEMPRTFTFIASVVRVENNQAAVQFLDLDEDMQADLYSCLAYEARRDQVVEEDMVQEVNAA